MTHLPVVILILLSVFISSHAVATDRRPIITTPLSPISSPTAELRNVTGAIIVGLPQPDFDAEGRVSAEEEVQDVRRKKKKKKKNSALKRALVEAARKGMEAMVELYDTVEPTMKRKGQVLSPDDPAAQLAMFSAPHFPEESDQSNRAAYAALYAAKRLKER